MLDIANTYITFIRLYNYYELILVICVWSLVALICQWYFVSCILTWAGWIFLMAPPASFPCLGSSVPFLQLGLGLFGFSLGQLWPLLTVWVRDLFCLSCYFLVNIEEQWSYQFEMCSSMVLGQVVCVVCFSGLPEKMKLLLLFVIA